MSLISEHSSCLLYALNIISFPLSTTLNKSHKFLLAIFFNLVKHIFKFLPRLPLGNLCSVQSFQVMGFSSTVGYCSFSFVCESVCPGPECGFSWQMSHAWSKGRRPLWCRMEWLVDRCQFVPSVDGATESGCPYGSCLPGLRLPAAGGGRWLPTHPRIPPPLPPLDGFFPLQPAPVLGARTLGLCIFLPN